MEEIHNGGEKAEISHKDASFSSLRWRGDRGAVTTGFRDLHGSTYENGSNRGSHSKAIAAIARKRSAA
jgi:hypothetical protein